MRLLALLVLGSIILSSCSTPGPKTKYRIGFHSVKVEHHPWPPEIGEKIYEEWSKDHPSHLVFGDWRMRWVTLLTLDDDESLSVEDIRKIEARVRELDRSK